MKKLLIICGPTATGKTVLALAFAKQFDGELISGDSRQVYKGLDALTGKDRSKEIPIWLYDVIDVGQPFSVAQYAFLAQRVVDNIHKRNKLPIVVGGTGLYISSLLSKINTLGIPPNPKLRKKLFPYSLDLLQKQLQLIDKIRWLRMNHSDQNNPRRLIRAIEIAKSKTIYQPKVPQYDALWIGLTTPVQALEQKISTRVQMRWDEATGEVRENLPPILGADPLLSFLRGEITKDVALQKWTTAEFQYAKRQITWFKKIKEIIWFDISMQDFPSHVANRVEQWYTMKNNDK